MQLRQFITKRQSALVSDWPPAIVNGSIDARMMLLTIMQCEQGCESLDSDVFVVKGNHTRFAAVCTLINNENDTRKCRTLYSETSPYSLVVPHFITSFPSSRRVSMTENLARFVYFITITSGPSLPGNCYNLLPWTFVELGVYLYRCVPAHLVCVFFSSRLPSCSESPPSQTSCSCKTTWCGARQASPSKSPALSSFLCLPTEATAMACSMKSITGTTPSFTIFWPFWAEYSSRWGMTNNIPFIYINVWTPPINISFVHHCVVFYRERDSFLQKLFVGRTGTSTSALMF